MSSAREPIWDPDVVGYCKVDDRAYLVARMTPGTPDPEPQRSIEKLRAMGALGEEELEIAGAFDGFTVTSDSDPGL